MSIGLEPGFKLKGRRSPSRLLVSGSWRGHSRYSHRFRRSFLRSREGFSRRVLKRVTHRRMRLNHPQGLPARTGPLRCLACSSLCGSSCVPFSCADAGWRPLATASGSRPQSILRTFCPQLRMEPGFKVTAPFCCLERRFERLASTSSQLILRRQGNSRRGPCNHAYAAAQQQRRSSLWLS